jgi:DnaJ homolog subfamily C member 19
MKLLVWIAVGFALWWLWRNGFAKGPGMSPTEAAKLLGVTVDATPETIIDAHKRLIAKVHPDAGGTSELAARINLARATLLKHLPE